LSCRLFPQRLATRLPMLATMVCGGAAYSELSAVAEPWVDAQQVGPFICQATFPLREYDPMLSTLPDLEREIDRALGLPPAHEPIYIYLFSDAESHRSYLHQHFPDVPYRRALFVKEGGLAAVFAYRHDKIDVDLRHECTHALLHANLPTVPLWLDEGLAEYFEVPPGQQACEHPNFGCLRWNMRLGIGRSMAELEERQELAEMGTLDYRYAWAWVHFMLRGPDVAHTQLVAYLADIHRGASAGKLSDRLVKSMPDVTDRMAQHFKNWDR
jgi:hypothetical protein